MRHKDTTERGAGARTAGTLTRPRAQTEGAGPQQAHATWTMVLRAWDADPEFDEPAGDEWLCILPKKWNKQQVYSWRYDPREFSAAAAPQADPRRRNAARMDCNE